MGRNERRSPIMKKKALLRALTAGFAAAALLAAWPASAEDKPDPGKLDQGKPDPGKLDKVSFGTNWVAEAEHGGHYQALADGTYQKYGLDVTIVPGGPNVNNRLLLPVGKLDFYMSANSLQTFDAIAQRIPIVAVAAMFQKEPQVLLAHPGQGVETFEDLKKVTLF